VVCKAVIAGEFFISADIFQSVKFNMIIKYPHERIGIATVIDKSQLIAVDTGINCFAVPQFYNGDTFKQAASFIRFFFADDLAG